jgi:neutral ceramidase
MMTKSKDTKFMAGAARANITPENGVQLAGDIARRRAMNEVREPLYAKVLVLESQGRKIGFVSLDLCYAKEPWITEIRRRAGKEIGIAPEALMIHSTHTHAAPSLGSLVVDEQCTLVPPVVKWLCGDEGYHSFVVGKIVEALKQANKNLQPARIGWAAGIEARVAFNRRFVMRDGTVQTHPETCSPRIRHVEGPTDPELGVIAIQAESSEMLAMVLNHGCHPVHGYPMQGIYSGLFATSGWPGAWAEGIERQYGPKFTAMVLNGCSGNIHHFNHLDPDQVDDYYRMGRILTETTKTLLPKIAYCENPALDFKVKHLQIPMRQLTPEQIEEARQRLKDQTDPSQIGEKNDWKWVYALSRMSLHEQYQRNPNVDCEVQVFRIGDIAFVGIPGEPFVEGQLKIKLGSPFYPTFAAGGCNSHIGYVPTRHGMAGGYEADLCNWSKLVPEALDQIADTAIDLLKEIKQF